MLLVLVGANKENNRAHAQRLVKVSMFYLNIQDWVEPLDSRKTIKLKRFCFNVGIIDVLLT